MSSTILCLLLFLGAAEARADSFVINNGSVTAERSAPYNNFTLSISGANSAMSARAFTTGGSIAAADQCFTSGPCFAGVSVNLGSNTGPLAPIDFFPGGSVTVNGNTYFISTDLLTPPGPNGVSLSGNLRFLAGSVVIPVTEDPVITLTAPFTMSGGFGARNTSGLFTIEFTGSGIATLVLNRAGMDGGHPTYTVGSVTYAFSPTSVPEPATMVMLGSGLASLGVKVLKRRKTRKLKS